MKELTVKINDSAIDVGNWANAKDLLPTIAVDQKSGVVTITRLACDCGKYPNRRYGETLACDTRFSDDKQVVIVTGKTTMKNYKRWQGSGEQSFCYIVFRGDSGHIYIHRAPATKGWMQCDPNKALARLRKLGIGAENVIQQGDFLLKPANGNAYPAEQFAHETMGAGHHKFLAPVLYADGEHGRQYRITEPITLRHEAVDGIQHPDVTVPVGIFIVGATTNSLAHSNRRD
ncbi:MAG: hypothetical protein PHC43_01280 [Candidatus Marinimicrobia bacterium]|jgi:hypothetical protein|nr:hypothetical protein [Candidatus Neomarinimicrobiota bacterium]